MNHALPTGGLTAEELNHFQENGFLIIRDFFTSETALSLKRQANKLVVQNLESDAHAIFSTRKQEENTDDWFLGSGDKIRLFWEEEREDGQPAQVNKIGHALHELDPIFREFSMDGRLAAIAQSLGFARPALMQSMYIFKPPRVGGEVRPHQDSTFLYTEPLSVVGFWFAVEDANQENGCLWALPGGHREALRERFVRAAGGGTKFLTLDERPLPDEGYVPLEVPAGSLVLLHGQLPHKSFPNRSAHSRNAYTLHITEATAQYPSENWLQRTAPAPEWG